MSDQLYWTILRWHNGVGLSKLHGNAVVISQAPDLGSGPVHQMEYVPEIDMAMVSMDKREPPRRMSQFERKAADEILRSAKEPDACRFDEPWKEGRC